MMYFSGSTGGQYTSLSSSSLVGKSLATIFCPKLLTLNIRGASLIAIVSFLPRWAWRPLWKQRALEELSGSISTKSIAISYTLWTISPPRTPVNVESLASWLYCSGDEFERAKKWSGNGQIGQVGHQVIKVSLTGLNDQQVITDHGYIFISKKIHVYWTKWLQFNFFNCKETYLSLNQLHLWINCIFESITSAAKQLHGCQKHGFHSNFCWDTPLIEFSPLGLSVKELISWSPYMNFLRESPFWKAMAK